MPVAGQRILAADFPAAAYDSDETQQTDIGTTPSAGSPEVGADFYAPTSGLVLVTISAAARDNGGTNAVSFFMELFEGADNTGTAVVSGVNTAYELRLYGHSNAFNMNGSRSFPYPGLTPGDRYYARVMQRQLAGTTADVFLREITICPLPS